MSERHETKICHAARCRMPAVYSLDVAKIGEACAYRIYACETHGSHLHSMAVRLAETARAVTLERSRKP